MNNIFVYCEITEDQQIADVSLELCTKARSLADELKVDVEAVLIGNNIEALTEELQKFGINKAHLADDKRLFPYQTFPHAEILTKLIQQEEPQIVLVGATTVGRDLAPYVASTLKCGLTADCTQLVIGEHEDKKQNKTYKDLLYQIRPAFGGNIVATIINPDTRPQMATVREGVMKKEYYKGKQEIQLNKLNIADYVKDEDFVIEIIERHIEKQKINIKNAHIIISGGYGVGSKENFKLLHDLAEVIGGEVGATRAAVDAGYAEHERQVGQTGITVRPKLYIACGISGQIQHKAGMEESAKIISINTDPRAPLNQIADYYIHGDVVDVLPKMIKYYRKNTK
jgi:electron transfer flavoprotein alpha subunit